MPMISVSALYDGKTVRLLEDVPVDSPYRVVVTFVEPVSATTPTSALERFWLSFGAWRDARSTEETIAQIRQDRRSRSEPHAL